MTDLTYIYCPVLKQRAPLPVCKLRAIGELVARCAECPKCRVPEGGLPGFVPPKRRRKTEVNDIDYSLLVEEVKQLSTVETKRREFLAQKGMPTLMKLAKYLDLSVTLGLTKEKILDMILQVL